ncbi:tudor domain-containing protein 3 [Sabethes cyaneus]|uniref:tudor domain-containing protein 3 n=1 Tax=Sabethes cyaneus TaxID=53552 RepID=UPI00237DA572|nr:tudor domain-containing protein 3 [Sabethes cyaneus]
MELLEQLQKEGWYLLSSGLEKLLEETTGTIGPKQVIKLALDVDLREIGGGALAALTSRATKVDSIDGNIVVQVLKIRNISAPKANEESKVAPRMLKLTLTDGQTQYSALENQHVSSLSLDTPPGTKIYLKNGPIKVTQGLLILNANNVSVLGGRVSALVDKWEIGRTMAKYAKGGRIQLSANGPPPWIPFGQKIQQTVPVDKNFKSLQVKQKDESKENAEFTALRNDAIAEANKLGTRKTFGGGAKQMVDANVQKIMDKGFTEDQATHALKLTRNNVHRALSNLQRIEERKQNQADMKSGKHEPPSKSGKRGNSAKRDSESEGTSKPSTKVSLFDFLEDILPESDTSNKKSDSKESTPFSAAENKHSGENVAAKAIPNSNPHYNTYPTSRSSNRDSSSAQHQSNSSNQHYNNPSKNYNQQRFENNISSSFANRNSQAGPSNRNYNSHQQQPHQSSSNATTGYKPSNDYSSSRYRGAPNAPSNNHASDTYQRGRHEAKYNQSMSSYHTNQNQQPQHQSHYHNDNYNNNNNAPTAGHGSKYQSNVNGSGKQSNPNYGYGKTESKGSQGYNNQGESRKQPNAPSHYQQQQQQQQHQQPQFQSTQQQPPYPTGSQKQVQGYNVSNNATGSHPNSHHGSTNNAYAPVNSSNNNNNNITNLKPQKGTRFNKEESQKFSAPPAAMSTAQGRKPPHQKMHNPQQPNSAASQPSVSGGAQQPFQAGNKQANTAPTANNNKVAQLTEATANMQISSGKPFNNGTNNTHAPNLPKSSQANMSGSTPVSTAQIPMPPKNFIQLPNGFNYNPYQIVGFQNKQTNEFALNVLKSQQFDAMQTAHLAAATQPGAPQAIPGVGMPPTTAVVPAVLGTGPAAPNVHPVMPSGVLPSWKIGDRCLAKYWEDGGFYNAEITGISENTFVVCFLEYGNYEEVLKTDCIPIGAPAMPGPAPSPHVHPPPPAAISFHHPSVAPHLPPGAPLMPAPQPPTGAYPGQGPDGQSVQHFNHAYKPQQTGQYAHHQHPVHQQPQSQHRPSKFREQRPMYVPPAQRK